MSAPRDAPGVILLHGIARTARSLSRLERALQRAGFATLNLDYASRKKPLEALAEEIHSPVAAFAQHHGPIHFVAHSMGGLLAQLYVSQYRPPRLSRIVMLGAPNGRSEVADFLQRFRIYRTIYGPAGLQLTTTRPAAFASLALPDCEIGIIAGKRTLDPIASFLILPRPNDGRVSVESSKLAGMADHVTVNASHTGLITHPAAIDQVVVFLRTGRFDPRQEQKEVMSDRPCTLS